MLQAQSGMGVDGSGQRDQGLHALLREVAPEGIPIIVRGSEDVVQEHGLVTVVGRGGQDEPVEPAQALEVDGGDLPAALNPLR